MGQGLSTNCNVWVSDSSKRYGMHQCQSKPVVIINGWHYCKRHAKIKEQGKHFNWIRQDIIEQPRTS